MKFRDIKKYTSWGNYHVDISFDYLETWIQVQIEECGLELNPDFQRGHVWNDSQRASYVEHVLKGGKSGIEVFFNKPDWEVQASTEYNDMVCVDGLQRITAVRKFMNNEILVFGHYYSEFKDSFPLNARLSVYVNDLQTKKDVLKWYLDLNSGGVVHTDEELSRVQKMYEEE